MDLKQFFLFNLYLFKYEWIWLTFTFLCHGEKIFFLKNTFEIFDMIRLSEDRDFSTLGIFLPYFLFSKKIRDFRLK